MRAVGETMMKTALLTGIVVLLIFSMMPSGVLGGDFSGTYHFSENPAMQSESIVFSITFMNNANQSERLSCIGVHFDWEQGNHYYLDPSVSNTSVLYLDVGETYVSNITVNVPANASVGAHNGNIYIRYSLDESGTWSNETYVTYSVPDFVVSKYTTGGRSAPDNSMLIIIVISTLFVSLACIFIGSYLYDRRQAKHPKATPWVIDLESDKHGANVAKGLIVGGSIGTVVILIACIPYSSNLGFVIFLLGFLPYSVIPALAGIPLLLWYTKDIRRIGKEGVRTIRTVSEVSVTTGTFGDLLNHNDFLEYSEKIAVVGNLIPKDIIALKLLFEKMLSEQGIQYRTIEEKPEEWKKAGATSMIQIHNQVYRFVLPDNTEISLGRVNHTRKASYITIFVSISPCKPENEQVVKDWKERIEGKLKEFVSIWKV